MVKYRIDCGTDPPWSLLSSGCKTSLSLVLLPNKTSFIEFVQIRLLSLTATDSCERQIAIFMYA